MISEVLFNFIGHFQTKYHSIDMNVFFVCSMPQNSTISQFQHMKLLPGAVTMVTMKKIPFISGSFPDNCQMINHV